MTSAEAVTVVIPALDSAATIGRCLHALHAARDSGQIAEVLVADGGSRDATARIARSWGATVIPNPHRHAAGGRQAGVDRTRSPLVAFLDSDCVPLTGWLDAALPWLRQGADGVGGPAVGLPSEGAVERFSADTFAAVMRFERSARRVAARSVGGSLVGGNMVYRVTAVRAAGGFDLSVGNFGEDIDLLWRLIDRGSTVMYEPTMVVMHRFPSTLPELMRTWYRYGRASSALARRHLPTPAVDMRIYRLLADSVLKAPLAPDPHSMRVLQVLSHLAGKSVGSLREGIINL